jgi:hypothetical protein
MQMSPMSAMVVAMAAAMMTSGIVSAQDVNHSAMAGHGDSDSVGAGGGGVD